MSQANEFTCSIAFDADNLSKHLNQQTAADLWRPLVEAYGTEFLLNYHSQNMSSYFVNSAVKFAPGNLATVQSAQNLYGGNYGGLENYFTYIRNYFGQGLYDQITAGFMQQSSVYTDSLRLEEWHLYGSSRIGIYQTNKAMAQRTVRIENGVTTQLSNTHIEQLSLSRFYTERGAKRYELSNHLGNVLTVVTDKKLPVCSGTGISYFIADVVSATDYSPFGAPLSERTWQGIEYRYGFNGKEKDDEVFGDGRFIAYEERIYDPSIARFYSTDPKEFNYPWQSTYCYFRNSPIGIYDYKGAGEPLGPENLNICEINPDVALEQDAPSQIEESNSRTYDGTIAHRAFTQYIRRNFPTEQPWKCNRNVNGKEDRSRPDLIYFSPDQRVGGVWEIKPIETILTRQAQNDVDFYVRNLNKLGGTQYSPGQSGGAPAPPIPFGVPIEDELTGRQFIFINPLANDGAIYWKEDTKPDRIPQLKPIIIVSVASKIIWDTFKNSANYAGKFALRCVNSFCLLFIIDPKLTNPELKEDWRDETY